MIQLKKKTANYEIILQHRKIILIIKNRKLKDCMINININVRLNNIWCYLSANEHMITIKV